MPGENELPKTPTNAVDSILMDMLESIPDIQPHVVDNVHKENVNQEPIAPKGGEKEVFNPAIHRANPDGSPVLTKTGKFRKKTGASKLYNPADREAQFSENPNLTAQIVIEANSLAAAEVVQNLKRSAYSNFLGQTYGEERHRVFVDATKSYFISCGGVSLTPLQALLLLEGQLLLESASKPKAIDKITKFKTWLVTKYLTYKGRKNGAQSGSRANIEREDDSNDKDIAQDTPANKSTFNRFRS